MKEFIDKASDVTGTPINRENLMAIQGFEATTTVFKSDGSIVETNSEGHKLTTTFPSSTKIVETFVGNKTITKTTTFESDGSITEAIS